MLAVAVRGAPERCGGAREGKLTSPCGGEGKKRGCSDKGQWGVQGS